jgi:hypothetical protein
MLFAGKTFAVSVLPWLPIYYLAKAIFFSADEYFSPND